VPADEKNYLEGADVYKHNCAVCHGLPEAAKKAIADGMAPKSEPGKTMDVASPAAKMEPPRKK
jgi:mono/diheme cytochrome c family protein